MENPLSNPAHVSPSSTDFHSNKPHASRRVPRLASPRSCLHGRKSLHPYPCSLSGCEASHAGRFKRIPSHSSQPLCMFEKLPPTSRRLAGQSTSTHGPTCLKAVTSSSDDAPCTCRDTSVTAFLASALTSPPVCRTTLRTSANASCYTSSAAGLYQGTESAYMPLPPRGGVLSPMTSGMTRAQPRAPFAGNATGPWSSCQDHVSTNLACHLLYVSWEDDLAPIDLKETQ